MMKSWYHDCINLEAYPITDPSHPRTQKLITQFQKDLLDRGSVEIPDFVTPLGIKRLVEESASIEHLAFHNALIGNAYLDEPEASLPEDHTKRLVEPTSLGAIGYDQIPPSHLLRQIYEWDVLMSFLGTVMRLDKIYRYGDPMGALNVSVMKDKDYLRWHFDQTDFVSSLAIRNADSGGEFEYVPMIRTSSSENYDKVRNTIKGSREGIVRIENKPGTLVLFKGRYSLHRVTEIKGETSRLIGLLGYDTKPGTKSSEYLHKIRYGRTL